MVERNGERSGSMMAVSVSGRAEFQQRAAVANRAVLVATWLGGRRLLFAMNEETHLPWSQRVVNG